MQRLEQLRLEEEARIAQEQRELEEEEARLEKERLEMEEENARLETEREEREREERANLSQEMDFGNQGHFEEPVDELAGLNSHRSFPCDEDFIP